MQCGFGCCSDTSYDQFNTVCRPWTANPPQEIILPEQWHPAHGCQDLHGGLTFLGGGYLLNVKYISYMDWNLLQPTAGSASIKFQKETSVVRVSDGINAQESCEASYAFRDHCRGKTWGRTRLPHSCFDSQGIGSGLQTTTSMHL